MGIIAKIHPTYIWDLFIRRRNVHPESGCKGALMKKKFPLPLVLIFAAVFCLGLLSGCAHKQVSSAITDYTATDKPMALYDDGWFAVYKITDHIYAIGEPLYFQGNFSYLVIGRDKALMIDATASITKNVVPVLKILTDKPIAVLPTHLHFDHIGGLRNFEEIWLADTPVAAGFKQTGGEYVIPLAYSLGFIDNYKADDIPPVKVSRLAPLNSIIDLGGVKLKVLFAPGHCKDEIVLFDETDNILFAGDYLYPSFLINGNAGEYASSTDRILDVINERTLILGGHADSENNYLVPVPARADILALRDFLPKLANKEVSGEEISDDVFKIKSTKFYDINGRISIIDDIVWENGTRYNY